METDLECGQSGDPGQPTTGNASSVPSTTHSENSDDASKSGHGSESGEADPADETANGTGQPGANLEAVADEPVVGLGALIELVIQNLEGD